MPPMQAGGKEGVVSDFESPGLREGCLTVGLGPGEPGLSWKADIPEGSQIARGPRVS